MTSMSKELGKPIDMNEVKDKIASCFSETFDVDIVGVSAGHNNFKT